MSPDLELATGMSFPRAAHTTQFIVRPHAQCIALLQIKVSCTIRTLAGHARGGIEKTQEDKEDKAKYATTHRTGTTRNQPLY